MPTDTPRPRLTPLWATVLVDQFPAQALEAARPALAGRPFAVVEQCEDRYRAAALALSPAARALGAEPGTPIFVLKRKHGRRLGVVPRDREVEAAVRQRLTAAFEDWTPVAEVTAGRARLEAHLDLTGTPAARRHGHHGVAAALQPALKTAAGLPQVAVGVSTARLVAQVLARDARPDGIDTCQPGAELERLAEVDAGDLPGLAGACRERARLYGLERVEQLRRVDRDTLVRRFGREQGERLYGLVRGLAATPRRSGSSAIEAETVLDTDLVDDGALREAVRLTADKACHELRRSGQVAGAVRLRLTYSDRRQARRTVALPAATDAFPAIEAAARGLFALLHVRRVAVTAVAVAATRTSPATGQGDLFEDGAGARTQRLGAALTDIRTRLGFEAVLPAGALELRRRD